MRRVIQIPALAVLALLLLSPGAALGRDWDVPTCSVEGLQSVSYTNDGGNTYAPNIGLVLPRGRGSFGLVALDEVDTLLAEYQGTIYRSTDAGCRWKEYATAEVSPLRFSSGSDGVAYAFGFFPGREIWRVDGKSNPHDRILRGADLPAEVLGIGVDPGNPDHLRVACSDGFLYESFNGGASKWAPLGAAAPVSPLTYFAAFDPSNLDNAVIGTATDGIFATVDGGRSWQKAAGLSSTDGPANAFNGVFSPAFNGIVYVMALDLNESDAGAPSGGRHIYRSTDGGLSFVPVVDQGGVITLTNGPTMAADPADANVVYFSFGSKAFLGGVYLYRYDHAAAATTQGFNTRYYRIHALAFNPTDPSTIYAGFEGE